jgi:dimethylargininase
VQPRPIALVRRPSPNLADGIVTHIDRTAVDAGLAFAQWERYVGVLDEHGWRVHEVSPVDGWPDQAFVEDTMVLFRNVAVIARPGADARRGEIAAAERVVTELGLSVNRIREPGTLDGGDVLKVGDTVYVGRGGRTNAAGIAQLRDILEPLGATVVTVPLARVLHLKSAVTALPDGTVVGWPPVVDDPSVFPRYRAMPDEAGAHVVLLGGPHLLMSASAPRSAELLEGLGYRPVCVDIGEFEKLEGCVTCLSVRVRHPRT